MPSSTSRSRVPVRRSPRAAARTAARTAVAAVPERPTVVPFAVVFAVLVAAEDLYLARLLWTPETGWDWFILAPAALGVLALTASVLVYQGRSRAWLVLALAAVLPLIGLLVIAALFAALGGGQAMWMAVLLCIGPLTCLVLALQRPVREWSGPGRAHRAAGGRRTAGSDR